MKLTVEINQGNYEKEVLNTHQVVLVNFWTTGCSVCQTIAPMLEEIAADYIGRVKIAKVNVDENPVLAERHHVQATPTLILFIKGLVRDQMVGLLSKKTIVEKLDHALSYENILRKRGANMTQVIQ